MDFALGDLVNSIVSDRISSFSDDFFEFHKKSLKLMNFIRFQSHLMTAIDFNDFQLISMEFK